MTFNPVDAFNELPTEAKVQIRDVYCVDENKTVDQLTIEEMKEEVAWVIEKITMDIGDGIDDSIKDLSKCKKWLREYCH